MTLSLQRISCMCFSQQAFMSSGRWLRSTFISISFAACFASSDPVPLAFPRKHQTASDLRVRMGRNRTFVHCWWVVIWRRCCENSSVHLQTSRVELPCDPGISLLGMYQKELRTVTQASTSTLVSTAKLSTAGEG